MGKAKPGPDDLRRLIGYSIITFLGVFLFIPVIWFIHLFSNDPGLYMRWGVCSAAVILFNIMFYFWKYPENWLANLLVLIGVDLMVLIFEYFWLIQSLG
ncbi:hypothetical protein [Desulfosporosinus meridiei]|uniref:Uncharacterized protein n=1 Tax=Desulfosporosinus meridiei (strain ATCC BAA-275 / DSM 13257 / KCTC 12902 / NCIMB 13706 / S10) TaxID=768704 RepID=J7J111_DESMD|nr:hypothetical protein [Desulfosporosinus meridiei]AFQ46054.1 hypothetical protein Desmer_4230 [Desulfosporosinus meridiei DSM 13257]